MSRYNGPSPLIANGQPLTASVVSDEFDALAVSMNNIDDTNWDVSDKRFITNRSVHHDALTVPFVQEQLIEDEPATFVVMGRGGSSKPTLYSLGEYENEYTVDGCCLRMTINRDALVKIDTTVQFDAIKISNYNYDIVTSPATATYFGLRSIDLEANFELYVCQPGSFPSLVSSLRKRVRLEAHNAATLVPPAQTYGSEDVQYFEGTNARRRGMTIHLNGETTLSGVDTNGAAYDVFLKMRSSIVAADTTSGGGGAFANKVLSNTDHNNRLFLVHAKSTSRYISARAFVI